jgi:hypothetical protein
VLDHRPFTLSLARETRSAASWAGCLALAAFVKRPQADVQIGANKTYSCISVLQYFFLATLVL